MMFNFEGKPGAVGRVPWFVEHRFPTALVRFDVETPAAGAQRRRLLHRVRRRTRSAKRSARSSTTPTSRATASRAMPTASETEKKILRDVFEPGDAWFRTGDLMRKDERRLFLFRRPHRRHLPLEGRERLDHRGGRGDQPLPRHRRTPTSMASRFPAAKAAPAWRRSSATIAT